MKFITSHKDGIILIRHRDTPCPILYMQGTQYATYTPSSFYRNEAHYTSIVGDAIATTLADAFLFRQEPPLTFNAVKELTRAGVPVLIRTLSREEFRQLLLGNIARVFGRQSFLEFGDFIDSGNTRTAVDHVRNRCLRPLVFWEVLVLLVQAREAFMVDRWMAGERAMNSQGGEDEKEEALFKERMVVMARLPTSVRFRKVMHGVNIVERGSMVSVSGP